MSSESALKGATRVAPDEWVDLYADQLYSYALQVLRDAAAAEDLVQETFLAALRNKDSFQGRSQEKTWLFGILKHKIVDSLRQKKRQPAYEDDRLEESELEALFNDDGSWKIPPSKWNARAEDLYERKQFFDTLTKCLKDLSERLSRVFTMRELEGVSSESICELLGITPNNLWIRMYRARTSIRRCLEEHWFKAGT
jgi:RNA polymerase sigma-70 factor (ECF subfamily)